jgi:hypothetical protein
MTTSKHPPSGKQPNAPPNDDLEKDPKIGQSRGTTMAGEDPDLIDGENTVEGDIANDTTRGGGVDPDQRGRTNP